MKNIHILPTDKPSRLHFTDFEEELVFTPKSRQLDGVNIYITSDEEIKEGDYFLEKAGRQFPIKWDGKEKLNFHCKKIILTTDQDLIKNGVQAIDDEFLEWFVKNPSCEKVKIKKTIRCTYCGQECCDNLQCRGYKDVPYYEIITPKEECKQEWKPKEGEQVWIKVFSNWSSGKYIGYDVDKKVHLVREPEDGGGHLFESTDILPYSALPNEPKQIKCYCGHRMSCDCGEIIQSNEDAEIFIENIINPAEPNEALKKAKQRYSKQETLEEAADNWSLHEKRSRWGEIVKNSFKAGANWQSERMYSEEEVMDIINSFEKLCYKYQSNKDWFPAKKSEWFEQFKKK